jgi:hypothetical protein
MAITLKNKKIYIDNIVLDNELVVEYVTSLPMKERDKAIAEAIGIGILAAKKGEISHFLTETEGQLGKHLGSLKALYELRELRFKETVSKGLSAEVTILQFLKDMAEEVGFANDEVSDTSTLAGNIKGNKTGDIIIKVDGDDDIKIGVEIKIDQSIAYGELINRSPLAKSDTALSQLIETSANRNSKLNIIVFDEDKVDSTIKNKCVQGISYIPNIGFITIISLLKNENRNLAIAYILAREILKSKSDLKNLNQNVLTNMFDQLVKVLSDYKKIKNEVDKIQTSSQNILNICEETKLLVDHSCNYLQHYLEKGHISEEELWNFINPQEIKNDIANFKKLNAKK